jgi:hypothetical protein
MIPLRYLTGGVLLGMAVVASVTREPAVLAACLAVALLVRRFAFHGRTAWLSLVPIVTFAAGLALLERLSRGAVSWLPARTIVVFLSLTAAARLWPWADLLDRARPGSVLWTPVLFALVTHHFVGILGTETVRVLRARSLRVSHRFGPGAFRALSWALVGIVMRCWVRAERFYAAQRLRGLAT